LLVGDSEPRGDTMAAMEVVRTIEDVRGVARGWRAAGLRAGLVPTMGALHDGHLTLVDGARAACDRTMATLFVNPLQFGPSEDFDAYPRTEARDIELLASRGCDVVFIPSVIELYPLGPPSPSTFPTSIHIAGMSERLCGAFRPGHFSGVATVVMKFFMIVQPDAAFFGEKDFQQLQIIRRMVRDLDVPIEIVGVPTVRETDGLAMSSRNQYLTPAERAVAPRLHAVLQQIRSEAVGGARVAESIARGRRSLIDQGFGSVDYISLVDDESLEDLETPLPGGRLVAAARLGRTRLIDNIPVVAS
jgi:pantoate--beta-alanine ligase